MPTYGYECSSCKEQFEVIQKITDDALSVHDGCGGSLRRLMYPVGIVFKGSGFHVNDYGKNGKKDSTTKPAEAKTESKTETKSETKAEPKTETKPESKSETTAATPAKT